MGDVRGEVVKLSEKQIYFRDMIMVLFAWAGLKGYKFSIGEVYRPGELKYECPHCKRELDFSLQDVYIYMGRSLAKYSKHQDKLALDISLYVTGIYITDKELYRPIGEFWKSLDPLNRWGGDFSRLSDPFHLEYDG